MVCICASVCIKLLDALGNENEKKKIMHISHQLKKISIVKEWVGMIHFLFFKNFLIKENLIPILLFYKTLGQKIVQDL